MRMEERSQPLTDGSILEYIVHGEFAWKETDVNSTYGAWWMSLRTFMAYLTLQLDFPLNLCPVVYLNKTQMERKCHRPAPAPRRAGRRHRPVRALNTALRDHA